MPKGLFTPKTHVFSAAEILLRKYQNPMHLNGARWRTTFFRGRTSRCLQNLVRQRVPFKCMVFWYIIYPQQNFRSRKKTRVFVFVCWSLTSLCHSNGHIETMPAREINPFTALTRIRSQFLRTQWSTSKHSEWTRLRFRTLSHRGGHVFGVNRPLGPIHTKNARLFGCGYSAADISKPHAFKWDPLADDVLEAAWSSPTEKNAKRRGQISCLTWSLPNSQLKTSITEGLFRPKTHVFSVAFCPYQSIHT